MENIEHRTSNIEHRRREKKAVRWLSLCLLPVLLFCGCACHRQFVGSRPFDFQTDSFAYANELSWDYHYDANGKWVHQRHEPPPDYIHHCFVVARSARQFFENAKFDPDKPVADDATYRKLIWRVVSVDPACPLPESKKIVIPGYANLRDFSGAKEDLLKQECGGAWESYFQRGHWRMIWPFSRASQKRTANRLVADLLDNRPPVIHLVRFPQLTINHAVLVFDAKPTPEKILFSVYDPNRPATPKTLAYDRASETFMFAANNYWPGGRVDVYEVYRSWDY